MSLKARPSSTALCQLAIHDARQSGLFPNEPQRVLSLRLRCTWLARIGPRRVFLKINVTRADTLHRKDNTHGHDNRLRCRKSLTCSTLYAAIALCRMAETFWLTHDINLRSCSAASAGSSLYAFQTPTSPGSSERSSAPLGAASEN